MWKHRDRAEDTGENTMVLITLVFKECTGTWFRVGQAAVTNRAFDSTGG